MELYVGQTFSNHWHEDGFEVVEIKENYVVMLNKATDETFEVLKAQLLATKPEPFSKGKNND